MKKVRYMISDAANMMQVESHVLRYWEEELELDVPRNEMGHRYYTEENMQQFRQIKKWKEEGYQLKAIKMMLHNENPNLEEAKQQEHTTAMSGETESEPEKDGQQMHVAVSHTNAAPAGLTKLEQFQLMMNDIVRNAIACGVIDTRMNACFDAEERSELENEIPAGRFAAPSEVADFVQQLIDAPSYLTGQIISFDGGYL